MSNLDIFRLFGDIRRWRAVDLRTTRDISHQCSSGVTFHHYNKTEIIEGIAKARGYSTDPAKFAYMMDGAAMEIPKFKKEYDRKVYVELIRLADQFKADSKP